MIKESKEDNQKINEDVDKRFIDDPGAIYRMYSVISYFIVLVIIGIPVWWYTTRVYRASLPLDEMFNVNIPSKTIRANSIPLSLEYDVLITIINPDPQNFKLDINAEDLNNNILPFLELVKPIANYTIKSQWLYFMDLGITTKKTDDHLIINEEQLPHIITPLEKKIWSHMSPRPSINLVLYIPHCTKPLYIYNRNKEIVKSNSFLSPGWGGIMILNADETSCGENKFTPDLKPIVSIFLAQLRELIGLKTLSTEDIMHLKHTKAKEMIDSTRRTLKSLAQLLSEISSIVISDEVADQIQIALDNAIIAKDLLDKNYIDDALKAAKIAYENSENAFSDPSLLALLYFPDDQKYAVYIPLFLPIMIPVFMSLTTLLKWYKKQKAIKLKTQ